MPSSDEVAANKGVPAPLAHALLSIIYILPLFVPIPTNINIVLTAAATVYVGSWRSVKVEPPTEAMTKKDAMKFPLMGSIMLFSLFLAFKFLPKDLVNLVLSAYFVLIGTAALVSTIDPLIAPFLPSAFPHKDINIQIPPVPRLLPEGFEFSFSTFEAVLAIPAAGFCYWYWTTKHWLGNNALGIAFSLQGIEHLSLGTVQNGVILLSGLFFYDVFWVFCTPVMVSVAKSFDAPIKLLFPRVPMPATDGASAFSMLGLGDIVIPGIFVAIILRYDAEHNNFHGTHTASGSGGVARTTRYFKSAFIGYVIGLGTTIAVMNIFQAAQPALLYIVPAVLITTFGHATIAGEAEKVFYWKEAEEEEEESAAAKKVKEAASAVVEESKKDS
jgi:minor histocompatibility antigen H13